MEVSGEVGEGEASAHPDAESTGGGPVGADFADGVGDVSAAEVLPDAGLEQGAKRPEAEDTLDDGRVRQSGERVFEIPAMLAIVAPLRVTVASLAPDGIHASGACSSDSQAASRCGW